MIKLRKKVDLGVKYFRLFFELPSECHEKKDWWRRIEIAEIPPLGHQSGQLHQTILGSPGGQWTDLPLHLYSAGLVSPYCLSGT